MSTTLTKFKTKSLTTAPFHARTRWGDMAALTESVRMHGVIEPPVVRAGRSGDPELIAGERRRRAAIAAGLDEIWCLVVVVDDATAIQMQVEENLRREDLHPLDECSYFGELAYRGFDIGDIAKRFGLTRQRVAQRLKLASLAHRASLAYLDGKIDDGAALALARLDDIAKQEDIVAAVEAGVLQPEEVESYVEREYSASLEDVPWRVSDAELVARAGACTACPKRSDVQRDLFAELRGVRCLDVDCWRNKMGATWDLAVRGASVHESDAAALFIPTAGGRPTVMRSSGMVDAEAACPHLTGHTWREAIGRSLAGHSGEPPTEYLAKDQQGRPRFLYREAIATRLVRKSDAASAQREDEQARDPVRPDGPSARAEAKVRRAIVDQVAERCAATDVDAWAWVVERVLASASARSVAQTIDQFSDQLSELGVKQDSDGLVELVRRSNRKAKQVAVAVLIRDEADVVGDLPETVREIAKLCDVDLKAVEKSARSGKRGDDA